MTEHNGMSGEYDAGFWTEVRHLVRTEIGERKYEYWIQPLFVLEASGRAVDLGCPNTLIRDYTSKNFAAVVERAIKTVAPNAGPVSFTFAPRSNVSVPDASTLSSFAPSFSDMPPSCEALAPGSVRLNPAHTFEDFVVGKTNNVAATAAMKVADSACAPGVPAINPLFLFGQSGLGKTHLLHAIALRALQTNPKVKILFITAETFMRRFVSAIKGGETMAFKDDIQSVDLLLIDDVHFIAEGEKLATQEEFLHRFNELMGMGKQVVLAGDRSPMQLDKLADRLRSRMLHGLTAELQAPDLDLRLAIIDSKLKRLSAQYPNVSVPDEVKRFVASRIAASTREVEGALHQIVYVAHVSEEPLTIDVARRELADRVNVSERRLTVDEIKRTVANFYGIKVPDMDCPRRTRVLVRPRQTAMYLAKSLTSRSYPEIGRRFGGRDHTTVMHAVKKIEELAAQDPVLKDEIEVLKRMLKEGLPQPSHRNGEANGGGR